MSKVLVIVHGAGKHMSDFHKRPATDLATVLGQPPVVLPCWYGDLSNIGAPVFGDDPEADAFRAELIAEIRQQQAEIRATQPQEAADFGFGSMAELVGDLVSDVTRYLFDAELQASMQARLKEVLDKIAPADEAILVSHSLGTVLSYDVLRARAADYNVTQFVTMGSPLHKVVKIRARPNDVGQIASSHVREWRNLYDTTDPVANPIGTSFPGYPIEDIFIDAATALIPSHDYWSRAPVLEMIAGLLR